MVAEAAKTHRASCLALLLLASPLATQPLRAAEPPRRPPGAGSLEAFLARPGAVRESIVWQEADGRTVPFDAWPAPRKRRLVEIYRKLRRGEKDLGLRLPSPKNVDPSSGCAYFTADQAFDVYAAHVAHSLRVEVERLVPWSLTARPPAELAAIFSSASYSAPIGPSRNTGYPAGIRPGRDFMEAPENAGLGELDGDPRVGFRFVTGETSTSGKSLVGKDELETLVNLTVWIRDDVGHGNIPRDLDETHRWLEDRLRPAKGEKYAVANAGCHSASKLMVDLARSANIPLLHVRGQERDRRDGHFFNRTHGGLIYGWGGREPRILWHTDDIYAMTGEPPFPIDGRGALLPPAEAARAYFDARWLTPAELEGYGFVYKLEKVYPGRGFGASSRGIYEDRLDYGMMSGYWRSEGDSKLHLLMRMDQHFRIGGEYILHLACNEILPAQLAADIASYRGGLPADQLPPMHSVEEYAARAKAIVEALGGCAAFREAFEKWKAGRGANLMR